VTSSKNLILFKIVSKINFDRSTPFVQNSCGVRVATGFCGMKIFTYLRIEGFRKIKGSIMEGEGCLVATSRVNNI